MWEQFIEDWENAKTEGITMKYKGVVTYRVDGGKCVYERGGFDNVVDATKWITDRFAHLMIHWADINENGFIVWGEVTDEESYSDGYELHCGC